ncbi:hypothetical protein BGZ96_003733 [Linnemannia gamsii]|uniref:Inositol phospholipid synthesis and fat-storage-inducing TM-domain-containing protein n=1 Tax=Linnemannia gamsii TaxID=64522 RepID=A0ABQ7K6J4_9FUNG|nr:hypothetical protein BGZ96_003733 [Linnemannia gamsii]
MDQPSIHPRRTFAPDPTFASTPSARDRAPESPNLSPTLSHATIQELANTPADIRPPTTPFSTFLLPHQYLVFIFPVTLLFGSLFGYIGGNQPSYFSNKRNILNILFVKNGWGWTSIAFFIYIFVVFGKALIDQQDSSYNTTSVARPHEEDESSNSNYDETTTVGSGTRTTQRSSTHLDQDQTPSMVGTNLPPAGSTASAKIPTNVVIKALARWGLATLYWWLISQWFFGPGLFDRVFVMTGGSCSIDGHWSQYHCRRQGGSWAGGIDISGHMFLLTHAWLFLMEELSIFLNVPEAWTALQNRRAAKYAVWGIVALTGLWWWMLLMTSVYYHHLAEKLTGLFFGVLFWFGSYVTLYKVTPFPFMPDQAVIL